MSGPRQITTLADASPYTPGSPMLRALMEDQSFFTCYESLQLARGAGAGSPAGVRRQSAASAVGDLDFSPNELTLRCQGRAPADARVILNQNWATGLDERRAGRSRRAARRRSSRR